MRSFFFNSAPGLPARHGAQPRGHVGRISSAVPGLPWSYTASRGCGTSTGIDPSPIRRRMTSRLGSVGQRCPPVSGEGSGQEGMLMSDRHYCQAITTSTFRIHPSPHGKQGAYTVGVGLSIIPSTEGYGRGSIRDIKEIKTKNVEEFASLHIEIPAPGRLFLLEINTYVEFLVLQKHGVRTDFPGGHIPPTVRPLFQLLWIP
ncbi:hypothetical protein PoB_000136400 [Plakobranchus ocellatus]|uniref:Nudix hydrolase domain-containing protein n=1 Tax=Plakobranchus ocellatus TaxID=259542 RepID=A0AAV3XYK8_9GAST|nr:hypothetical protein PoB_000136400 [Plakobranchus ocellatus]